MLGAVLSFMTEALEGALSSVPLPGFEQERSVEGRSGSEGDRDPIETEMEMEIGTGEMKVGWTLVTLLATSVLLDLNTLVCKSSFLSG